MKKLILVVSVIMAIASTGQAQSPDSTEALKKQIEGILQIAAGPDKGALMKASEALILPNARDWFRRVFGENTGMILADEYSKLGASADPIAALFASTAAQHRTVVSVMSFDVPGDSAATGLQQRAMAAMKNSTRLYSVRMVEPGKDAGMHLWSFVYADGAFRLAGKMNALPEKPLP